MFITFKNLKCFDVLGISKKRSDYNSKYVKKNAAILYLKVKYRSQNSKDIRNEFLDSKSYRDHPTKRTSV